MESKEYLRHINSLSPLTVDGDVGLLGAVKVAVVSSLGVVMVLIIKIKTLTKERTKSILKTKTTELQNPCCTIHTPCI